MFALLADKQEVAQMEGINCSGQPSNGVVTVVARDKQQHQVVYVAIGEAQYLETEPSSEGYVLAECTIAQQQELCLCVHR